MGAAGAAAALAASALIVAPAAAAETAPKNATLDEVAVEAMQIEGVVGVTVDADGIITVSTLEEGAEGDGGLVATSASVASAKKLEATYDNVVVDTDAEQLVSAAQDEVVGGAGYVMEDPSEPGSLYTCSLGFSAWSPQGEPALISAGHCANDGSITDVYRSVPSEEQAVGGPGFVPMDALGTFGFSQYGGPGNSDGSEGGATSTDISIIDDISGALTLRPEVTDWTTAGSDDLAASTTKVESVGTAEIGEQIERSGRTTGRQTGVVIEEGWMSVSNRWVKGYGAEQTGSEPLVLGGDSGGSVVQGTEAVGVTSGGSASGDYLWYTDLQHGLQVAADQGAGEYQVMLDLAEPGVSKKTVTRGGTYTGTAPAGSTVTISGDITATAKADANGEFTFQAPREVGSFDISLVAKQGYNVSDKVNATVKTSQITVDAPGITSPENELTTTDVITEITGTGDAGATIALKGDAEGSTTVKKDGTWSVETELGFGAYTVGVTQSRMGVESEARWVSFQVVPGAPSIVTPENGGSYVEGQLPAVIGESGIEGAMVDVSIEGDNATEAQLEAFAEVGDTEVVGGTWMVDFDAQLAPGTYTVTATQSTAGVSSAASEATFEVVVAEEPAPSPEPTPEPTPAPEEPGNGGGGEEPGNGGSDEEPAPAPAPEQPGDELPATGADMSMMLPLAGGAAVALLAGGILLAVRRAIRA
ncbi:S1 family peptidase [Microbacterium sp. G2-8]|uniref:S1 family peptidase n=1 Tax=Microbacterium sp. G2-8 TaxID=2842454 RepID=UPI001C8912FA|nr:S1 family peptidase [Microbacterium sp. G2-8]